MAEKNETPKEVGKIEFFGSADRNVRGQISSSIPAWMLGQHIEELQESIGRKERALKLKHLPAESVPYAQEELSSERARLEEIIGSKPKLSGAQKDKVARVRSSLQKQIQETMPTLRDDRGGFVRPHDEYDRLKGRHIKIDKPMAESLGIKTSDGKITGDQANRAYQILSAAIGEDGSTERLRRDWGQPAYRTEDPLVQEIMGNGR